MPMVFGGLSGELMIPDSCVIVQYLVVNTHKISPYCKLFCAGNRVVITL
jgi:hypothetical protein